MLTVHSFSSYPVGNTSPLLFLPTDVSLKLFIKLNYMGQPVIVLTPLPCQTPPPPSGVHQVRNLKLTCVKS